MSQQRIDVEGVLSTLREKGIIEDNAKVMGTMSGTTDGLVYTLAVHEEPKYIFKIDHKESIRVVSKLHQAYINSPLLPKLIYRDPVHDFIVYTYVAGTTHYNRGAKKEWLSRLVQDLLNHYSISHDTDKWGRLERLRDSWREFNERSLEGARMNLGDLLPNEDYERVKSLLDSVSQVDGKYLLHGDTGVHNFVYRDNEIVGVIDPSPMVGPVIYDYTYAYCSSPDDLDLETLLTTYDLLDHSSIDKSRLIDNVIFQLYCRIGICAKVHPHDLSDYLHAWEYWRGYLN
ncbi:hypothetical protein E0485_14800 [Paenibacillus albiflavus]|uniref:Aminoglycoside phosphotransferase domain-containing protein n=1 Tax=Paenibacillus albiflavus TaxID=2545760 RepID=A0A4R4E962_9BACL|nr:phosphotransferase [Paenibacillus albiflavus]TCZ76109.1 hypothetical protein E0485_14800 [Paenibacillus albiflavus]